MTKKVNDTFSPLKKKNGAKRSRRKSKLFLFLFLFYTMLQNGNINLTVENYFWYQQQQKDCVAIATVFRSYKAEILNL